LKQNKIFNWIIVTIFIILVVIMITQILLKLTSHSPTDIQILYVSISVILSYLLLMSYKLGIFVGEVKEFMNTSKNSFYKIEQDKKDVKKL